MDVSASFFDSFKRTFLVGLGQKLTQLEQLASGNGEPTSASSNAKDKEPDDLVHYLMIWEDFPRKSPFFVSAIQTWLEFPEALRDRVCASVLAWGALPFSVAKHVQGVHLNLDCHVLLVKIVWSRCVCDLIMHAIRFDAFSGEPERLRLLALTHMKQLEAWETEVQGNGGGMYEILKRAQGQAQLQWAAVVGKLCHIDPSFIGVMAFEKYPLVSWYFVDLTLTDRKTASGVLSMLSENFEDSKQEKITKLLRILVADKIIEHLDFRSLADGNKSWATIFNDIILSKFYNGAREHSKVDELKAASLCLMHTILVRSPKSFSESNYQSFFNKRVMKHLVEPRKVTHSLEILLRSLRSRRYRRPLCAWDAFEEYCPRVRYREDSTKAPVAFPSALESKSLDSIFTDIFERGKSKALASLAGSLYLGRDLGFAADNSTGNTSSAPPSPSSVTSSFAYKSRGSDMLSVTSSSFFGGASGFVNANLGSMRGRGLYSLARNLRVCKHIILQFAAHDLNLFENQIQTLLSVPEDLFRCSQQAHNRLIVTMRALWDIFGPGYSVFRTFASSLRGQVENQKSASVLKSSLASVLRICSKKLTVLLESFLRPFGTEAIGQSDVALVPTVLWENRFRDTKSEGPNSRARDMTGETMGYPFAWSDPDKFFEDLSLSRSGLGVELQNLVTSHELFESHGALAFRVRNLHDKMAAFYQIARSDAKVSVATKKLRSSAGLDVLKELLYALPILVCSPLVGALGAKHFDKSFIPPCSLLLHADWSVACAASHCLQRIVACAHTNQIRMQVFLNLFAALSCAVNGSRASLSVILTYLRQVLVLFRLWQHVRSMCISTICPKPLEPQWAQTSLVLALSLLTVPCATIRSHAVELIECVKEMWAENPEPALIGAVFDDTKMFKYSCTLGDACSCAGASLNEMEEKEKQRRATVMHGPSLRAAPGSPHSDGAKSTTPRSLSVVTGTAFDSGRSYNSTEQQQQRPSTAIKGSSAPFRDLFRYQTHRGTTRDEMFLWYGTSPVSVGTNEFGSTNNTAEPAGELALSTIPKQWKNDLVWIAHKLASEKRLQHILHKVSKSVLEWIQRLPGFTPDASLRLEISMRRTASCYVVALAGAGLHDDDAPLTGLAPQRFDAATESMTQQLWDDAASTPTGTKSRIEMRYALQHLVGDSSCPRSVGRFVFLVCEWRANRLKTIREKSASAAADISQERGFLPFRRRGQAATGTDSDESEELVKLVEVEKVAINVVRIILNKAQGSILAWESVLSRCFVLIGEIGEEAVVESAFDWTLSFEYTKLIYQCAKSLSKEFAKVDGMDAIVRRADKIWPRARRRATWKLLQRFGGFHELQLYQPRNLDPSNARPYSVGSREPPRPSSPRTPQRSPRANSGGSLFPRTRQGSPALIDAREYQTLVAMSTRASIELFRLGPTSLGAVAPKPDDFLWSWFKSAFDVGEPEARIMRCYLTAHWPVGDIDADGGGTFSPFVDQWYQENEKSGASHSTFADAVFTAIHDAIMHWLFRGPQRVLYRALEPNAMAPLTVLCLVQVRHHEDASMRRCAFALLDVLEQSWARHSQKEDQSRTGRYKELSYTSRIHTREEVALSASQALAESCSDLAPALIQEMCARLPSLYRGGQAKGAVEMILPWCRSPSVNIDASGSPKVSPVSSPRLDRRSRGSSKVDLLDSFHTDVDLNDVWQCSATLYPSGGTNAVSVTARIWSALSEQHSPATIRFLISKVFKNVENTAAPIAPLLLCGVCADRFLSKSYQDVLEQISNGVMFLPTVSQTKWHSNLQHAQRPLSELIDCWVDDFALQNGDATSDSTPAAANSLRELTIAKCHALRALNVCIAIDIEMAAAAFPQAVAFSLCAVNVEHPDSPKKELITLIFDSLLAQQARLDLEISNDKISAETIYEIAKLSPCAYSDAQLGQAIRALHSYSVNVDHTGSTFNAFTRCVLMNACCWYFPLMRTHPAIITRCMKVYMHARGNISGVLLTTSKNMGVLESAQSMRLEYLALFRILVEALSAKLTVVAATTTRCILLLDTKLSCSIHSWLSLALLSYVEGPLLEGLFLRLASRLPLSTNQRGHFLEAALANKLQKRIAHLVVNASAKEKQHQQQLLHDWVDLFTRGAVGPFPSWLVCHITTIIPLCMALDESNNDHFIETLSNALTSLPWDPEAKEAIVAYLANHSDENLAHDAVVAICNAYGEAPIGKQFTKYFFEVVSQTTSVAFIAAALEFASTLLECFPRLLSTLERIVVFTICSEFDLSDRSLLRARDVLIATASNAGFTLNVEPDTPENVERDNLSDGETSSPLTKFAVISVVRERLQQEAVDIRSIMGSSATISSAHEVSVSKRSSIVAGFRQRNPDVSQQSPPKTESSHDFDSLEPVECIIGGVASFDASKHTNSHNTVSLEPVHRHTEDLACGLLSKHHVLELLDDPDAQAKVTPFLEVHKQTDRRWVEFVWAVLDFQKDMTIDKCNAIHRQFVELDQIDTLDLSDEIRDDITKQITSLQEPNAVIFASLMDTALGYLAEHFLGAYLRSVDFALLDY